MLLPLERLRSARVTFSLSQITIPTADALGKRAIALDGPHANFKACSKQKIHPSHSTYRYHSEAVCILILNKSVLYISIYILVNRYSAKAYANGARKRLYA